MHSAEVDVGDIILSEEDNNNTDNPTGIKIAAGQSFSYGNAFGLDSGGGGVNLVSFKSARLHLINRQGSSSGTLKLIFQKEGPTLGSEFSQKNN